MNDGTPTQPRLRIRVKVDRLRLLLHEQYGARSDSECARVLGCSQPTLARRVSDKHGPSSTFIAAAMYATGQRFEDLFELVDEQGRTVRVPHTVGAAA